MQDWGFDFVRIPMAYPYYVEFDRSRNIHPDEVYQINEQKVGDHYFSREILEEHYAPGLKLSSRGSVCIAAS